MLTELTISRKTKRETALDDQQLYAAGLQHVQRLASRIWTDYNVHDPGVTTLELLCYALTDLSYRASFPMEDLLAVEKDNGCNMRDQFFSARRILPNRPLTLRDYRKLLIDLESVRNAWLQPAPLAYFADRVKGRLLRDDPDLPGVERVEVAGLYRVIIDYREGLEDDEKAGVDRLAMSTLQAHRNLCEDFVELQRVDSQPFLLCSELELAPEADAEEVKAQVLFQVQDYLAPAVPNHTLSEMLERRKADGSLYTVDEIFDGPPLRCGFIDDGELEQAELRTAIRLSDVISIIMDIPGVQAVRDIVINPKPEGGARPQPPANPWVVSVKAGCKAVLDVRSSTVGMRKRNLPAMVRDEAVQKRFEDLAEAARVKAETSARYDLDIPRGTFRRPARYLSFQNHFPEIYGIGPSGLGNTTDNRRKAMALQLKGYLLFFDQLMADYLAQLSHVKDLFSIDSTVRRTYFYQVVDSFAEFEKVYAEADIVPTLRNRVEDRRVHVERRNRFLDHLIARFAERFHDFAHIMVSRFGFSGHALAAAKCRFLKSYPKVSGDRGLAYNASLKAQAALWDTANVSGLEKRIARLLGIRHTRRRDLANVALDAHARAVPLPGDDFGFEVRHRKTGKVLLVHDSTYPTAEAAEDALRRAILQGLLPSGYRRELGPDGKPTFHVADEENQVLARTGVELDTEEDRDDRIDEVMEALQRYSSEGLHCIENILLRPEAPDEPFLHICAAAEGVECAQLDPYSYRIHLILPAYGGRFSDMEFRRFSEAVIRQETPAHILPKICWVSREDMALFEKRYRSWIGLKAGADTADRRQKLEALVEALATVKNVYLPSHLFPCDREDTPDRFLLGRTALGKED